jgi:hypothetical protein
MELNEKDIERQEERRKILATVFLRGRQSRTNVIASNEVVNQALEALEKLGPSRSKLIEKIKNWYSSCDIIGAEDIAELADAILGKEE